jgi:hypothetical protein
MNYSFVDKSSNVKTGPIPVTMTEQSSCPESCPFMNNGCYAENFPLKIHWAKLNSQGLRESELFSAISQIKEGLIWRHNVAGDLPSQQGTIDRRFLNQMILANKGKKGFTYTHHKTSKRNLSRVKYANDSGFTVNVSALNLDHAAEMKSQGFPTVVVVPRGKASMFKHNGELFQQCPATIHELATCENCQLCADPNRRAIITFPAHGARAKAVEAVL